MEYRGGQNMARASPHGRNDSGTAGRMSEYIMTAFPPCSCFVKSKSQGTLFSLVSLGQCLVFAWRTKIAYFGKMPSRRSGKQLELMQTLLVALPSFILFGYNQSGVGGLLSIQSWVKTFPEIDTLNTTGSQKETNSTIQVGIIFPMVWNLGPR